MNTKKIISFMLCIVLALGAFALVGCGGGNNGGNGGESGDGAPKFSITVAMPDGAPALAMAQLMAGNNQFGGEVEYKVVAANNIKNYVVGNGELADVALVPVNLASLLLGQGDAYKMVASVTHGNLYLLSKNQTEIKAANAAEALQGKTVAVVNVAAVPGLTTKAMLEKLGLEVVTDEADKTDENVLVKGITGTEIVIALNDGLADYVVAPEPAVTNITAKVAAIKKVGALHEIYGKYPQAVMVVKTELLQNNKQLVEDIFDAMVYNQTYVLNNPADAADAIFEFMEDGVVPTFAAATITTQTVYGCSINVMSMTEEAIAEINGYIEDIIPLGGETPVAKPFAEGFFVDIKA